MGGQSARKRGVHCAFRSPCRIELFWAVVAVRDDAGTARNPWNVCSREGCAVGSRKKSAAAATRKRAFEQQMLRNELALGEERRFLFAWIRGGEVLPQQPRGWLGVLVLPP